MIAQSAPARLSPTASCQLSRRTLKMASVVTTRNGIQTSELRFIGNTSHCGEAAETRVGSMSSELRFVGAKIYCLHLVQLSRN
jgi:hypothetical protein